MRIRFQYLAAILAILSLNVNGQSLDVLSAPQSPAFQLLGISPTTIERPSDPTDVVISALHATDEFTRIPSSYAVEIAPIHLFRKKQTARVSEFLDSTKLKYNLRNSLVFSAGTTTRNSEILGRDISRLGLGLRLSLIRGKADKDAFYSSTQIENLKTINAQLNDKKLALIDADPIMEELNDEEDLLSKSVQQALASAASVLKDANESVDQIDQQLDRSLRMIQDIIQLNMDAESSEAESAVVEKLISLLNDSSHWCNYRPLLEESVFEEAPRSTLINLVEGYQNSIDDWLEVKRVMSTRFANSPTTREFLVFGQLTSAIDLTVQKLTNGRSACSWILDSMYSEEDVNRILDEIAEKKNQRLSTLTKEIDAKLADELDDYENTLRGLEVKRYGFKLDVAAGTVVDFPTQEFDLTYLTESGFWFTGAYDWKNGNSLLATARLLGNANQFYLNDAGKVDTKPQLFADFGLKYVFTTKKKISIQGEAIGREYLINDGVEDVKGFDDYKLALTIDYKWKPNQIVSFTFGRDVSDDLNLTRENLLLALNLVFGIGANRGSLTEYADLD